MGELEEQLHYLTTPIYVEVGNLQNQGTGFFYEDPPFSEYMRRESPPPIMEDDWTNKKWLVTNRHVLLGEPTNEVFPENLTFYFRKGYLGINENSTPPIFVSITLDRDYLLENVKFHVDKEIDVVVIEVTSVEYDMFFKHYGDLELLDTRSVSKEHFPENIDPNIEVADDVLIIGYPKGVYDEVNTFPIVKSGIISSKWNANFEAKPHFLIDAKLFPGSSGSIVIKKLSPLNENYKVRDDYSPVFVFLGIFSGEYPYIQRMESDELEITVRRSLNVGIVWYGKLIDDIVNNGKMFSELGLK